MRVVRDDLNEPEFVGEHEGKLILVEPEEPILDYPVIEPSGVVLKVDREKLEVAACNAFNLACDDAPVDGDMLWRRTVDAILTSLAEDGFREVEVLDGRFKVELLADGRFAIVRVEDEGAQVALIKGETLFHKPLPPAKED